MAMAHLSLSKDGIQADYRFISDFYIFRKFGSANYHIKIDLDGEYVGSLKLVLGEKELNELRAAINNIGELDGQN